jgi:hypothetical protein
MTKGFAKFSLEEFVRLSSAPAKPLELTAAQIQQDGEYLIIRVDRTESGTVYRLPKSAVKVLGPTEDIDDAKNGYSMRILIEREAPCLRLTAAQACVFFSDIQFAPVLRAVRQAAVAFTSSGEGHLTFGTVTTPCLGNPTVAYTRDLTVQGQIGVDKFLRKFSNEFQVWMDFAILIMGQRGIYIHEGPATIEENGGPSAGCIHVAPGRAKEFYDFVAGPTRILITYPW